MNKDLHSGLFLTESFHMASEDFLRSIHVDDFCGVFCTLSTFNVMKESTLDILHNVFSFLSERSL